jgi:putative endonuclease
MTIFRRAAAPRRNLRREGALGEEIAAGFLARHGYRIIERNFRFRRSGEIDIVARDGEDLVFCEVKMRSSDAFGLPEEAVTPSKQRRIRKIAAAYLAVNRIAGRACRFDVVSIRSGAGPPEISLFRDAF